MRRAATFGYPRIFHLTAGYRRSAKWGFAAHASHLAGRPYTPFDFSASQAQQRAIFDLNRVNAVRLPDYIRVDIRADRVFTVRGKPLRAFASAQNVVDRQNIAGYTWNRRSNQVEVNKQVGLFPLAGLEWTF